MSRVFNRERTHFYKTCRTTGFPYRKGGGWTLTHTIQRSTYVEDFTLRVETLKASKGKKKAHIFMTLDQATEIRLKPK